MRNPEEEQANIGCNGIQLRLRLLLQIPPLLDMKALCFAYIYCNARMLKRHLFRWVKSSKWALQTYSKMTISSLYCAIYKYEFAIRIHQLIWYSSSLAPSDANLPPYRIWQLYALLTFYCKERMLKRHIFRWLESSEWAIQIYIKITSSFFASYCSEVSLCLKNQVSSAHQMYQWEPSEHCSFVFMKIYSIVRMFNTFNSNISWYYLNDLSQ